MSESPRLSRRELRELGKLESLPDSAPSITDTAELRLRRPSRKELREAAERERAEMEARQEAQARDDAEADESDDTLAEEPVAPSEGTESEGAEPSDAVGTFDDSQDADDDGESTQAMDALPADGAFSADEPADEPADEDVAEPEETPDTHERKSVFERFEDDQEVEAELGEGVVAPEHNDLETAEEIDGDEDVPLRDRFIAMTKKDEPTDEVSAETQAMVTPSAEVTVDESDSQAVAEGNEPIDDDDHDDVGIEAPRRTWLNILIVILIGVLLGYLGGSWINQNYLSAPAPFVPVEIANLLL